MKDLFVALLFLPFIGTTQIQFSEKQVNLGTIDEAYEIRGDVTIGNIGSKKVFLMRADAEKGIRVFTSKKTLLPGDTCLLVISFIPETNGRFNKKINLVTTDKEKPYEIYMSGTLSKVKSDDKSACYYFGNRRNNQGPVKEMPAVVAEPTEKRDNSNRMPEQPSEPIKSFSVSTGKQEPQKTQDPKELSLSEYKPNNILFLVDVSGSMKDSLKLPLMKTALHTLIDAVRAVDLITFVTYADTVKVIREAIKGSEKNTLHDLVSGLKAHGLTKGNKAILFSQALAQKSYIKNGNNQVLLATDGKFRFNDKDYASWAAQQGDKKIVMSTVAFGNDREALKNLKDIATKGEGSFIHIKSRKGSEDKLLNELKDRSRRQ